MGPTTSWYALRAQSSFEQHVAIKLNERGYEAWCPTYFQRRQLKHRAVHIETALFPGYLFTRLEPCQHLPLHAIPKALSLVLQCGAPAVVPDADITAVRAMLDSGFPVMPTEMAIDDKVRVVRGSLMGQEGVIQRIKGETHLVVNIQMLGRGVSVRISQDDVEPIK